MNLKKLIILAVLICFASCQDFLSNAYIKQNAQDKKQQLWSEMTKDQSPLDFYNDFEVAKIMLSDMWVTFRQKGDTMPEGRKKLIHTTGNIAISAFIAEKNSPYTGVFQGSNQMFLRFSLAKKVMTWFHTSPSGAEGNFVPGISLKFLRDGVDSANLVAMYSINGQSSWNPFKNHFTNVFTIGRPGIQEKSLAVKFSTLTNNISSVGLMDMASYGEDGQLVAHPKYPFKLIFKPTSEVSSLFPESYEEYFTTQLPRIPRGTTVYQVYAIDEPRLQ